MSIYPLQSYEITIFQIKPDKMKRIMISALMLLMAVWSVAATKNEDGSRLWLRMENPNQERPRRLPASRAIQPAVYFAAEDAHDGGVPVASAQKLPNYQIMPS